MIHAYSRLHHVCVMTARAELFEERLNIFLKGSVVRLSLVSRCDVRATQQGDCKAKADSERQGQTRHSVASQVGIRAAMEQAAGKQHHPLAIFTTQGQLS